MQYQLVITVAQIIIAATTPSTGLPGKVADMPSDKFSLNAFLKADKICASKGLIIFTSKGVNESGQDVINLNCGKKL